VKHSLAALLALAAAFAASPVLAQSCTFSMSDMNFGFVNLAGGAAVDQDFHFIGAKAFHHKAGELHFVKGHGHLFVEGDVDGNGRADFRIDVHGASSLTSHDFVL